MKFRKFLGWLLSILGGLAALFALLAILLPQLQNTQVRLILASFETHSRNVAVNTINQGMLYVLHNPYQILAAGGIAMVLGLALLFIGSGQSQEASPSAAAGPYTVLSGGAPARTAARQTPPQWRRPASRQDLPSSDDFRAPPTPGFAPAIAAAQPPPNPYRSYGQSAYAPPSAPPKADAFASSTAEILYQHPEAEEPAPISKDAAYRRPEPYVPETPAIPKSAATLRESSLPVWEELLPADAKAQAFVTDMDEPPLLGARAFRKPGLAGKKTSAPFSPPPEEASPITDSPSAVAGSTVRIRSTVKKARRPGALKPLSPVPSAEEPPETGIPLESSVESPSETPVATPLPSPRIRSTMGKKKA